MLRRGDYRWPFAIIRRRLHQSLSSNLYSRPFSSASGVSISIEAACREMRGNRGAGKLAQHASEAFCHGVKWPVHQNPKVRSIILRAGCFCCRRDIWRRLSSFCVITRGLDDCSESKRDGNHRSGVIFLIYAITRILPASFCISQRKDNIVSK